MRFLILLLLLPIPAFAGTTRPNILFAIADDWGLHAGAYGTKWVRTPAFDRVAKEGVIFRRAYTPNAKCAPSRACILTGRNSWQLKEAANHIPNFPPEFKGWCEVLAEHDWFVGHTTKGWGPGSAVDAAGKPRQLTGRGFNARKLTPATDGIHSADYAANFTDFLDAAPSGKPWCFWYGCVEPHRSYEYGSGVAKGGKKLADIDRVPGYWPDNETVRNDILDYALEVEHFDTHLGRMLAELEKRGLLSNTIVVVTSDHAMPFPRVKGNTYEAANHIPLAMMWQGGIANPGRSVEQFVSFIDVAPTFIELAGITHEKSGMTAITGASLLPILRGEKGGRDFVLIGKERTDVGRPHDWGYPTRGIIKDGWLFLKNYEPSRWPGGNPETGYTDSDAGATKSFILDAHRKDEADPFWQICFGLRPGEELYDLGIDPDCLLNRANDPAAAARLAKLSGEMTAQLTKEGDPRMAGNGHIFDDYKQSGKNMINFYERFMSGENIRAGWINQSDIDPKK